MEKQHIRILRELTELNGPSGFEKPVCNYMKEKLQDLGEISGDNLGSILCRKQGTAENPSVMIASHMDEIGFLVNRITKEGYIKFVTLGGWWDQVLLAQKVTVLTDKGEITGVIGSVPPHLLEAESRNKVFLKKDMFIDVGAESKEDAEKNLGIKPGDPIVPQSEFFKMANRKYLAGKALDNRAGCALVIEILEELNRTEHPNTVWGAATVQEEVGLRGARTSAAKVRPDAAFVVDVTIAGDTPGKETAETETRLGGGPCLTLADASMIPHRGLRDLVTATAEEQGIPLQFSTMMGGGTDGGEIHKSGTGVPTIFFGLPVRYLHSHCGICHEDDYLNLKKLLLAVTKKLDKKELKKLTDI